MLHNVILRYVTIIWSMIDSLRPYANHLLWAFLTLDVVFLGFFIASGKISNLGAIVERIFTMGVIVLLVTNFTTISVGFKNGIVQLLGAGSDMSNTLKGKAYQDVLRGRTATDTGIITPHSLMDDPSQILTWALMNLQEPLYKTLQASNDAYDSQSTIQKIGAFFGGTGQNPINHLMDNLNTRIAFNIVNLLIQLAFIVVAVQLTLSIIEFYLVVFFALLLVPFIAWQPLRFIGMRAFTAVIAQALKLGITLAIISLGMNVLMSCTADILSHLHNATLVSANPISGIASGPAATIDDSVFVNVLAASLLFAFLCLQVPSLAMSIISGTPALSTGGFAQNLAGIAGIGLSAVTLGISGIAGARSLASSSQGQSQHSYPASAPGSQSPSSGHPSGPAAGAQGYFQPSPSAAPSGGAKAAQPGTAAKVNPVSADGKLTATKQPADQMFQGVTSPAPSAFSKN